MAGITTNPLRFEIHPASNNGRLGYRVHEIDAKNGKIILWSQVYNDKRDATYAIALTKRHAATAPVKDLTQRRAA